MKPRVSSLLPLIVIFAPHLVAEAGPRRQEAQKKARAAAAFIDARLERMQTDAGLSAAPIASQDVVLRRMSLDLTGVVPQPETVANFRRFESEKKLETLVETFLATPEFNARMGELLARGWVGASNERGRRSLPGRIASNLEDGVGLDELVRRLLLEPGLGLYDFGSQAPEQAALAARAFLGASIGCAQCHDHPFSDWSQEAFHGFAANFTNGVHSYELKNGQQKTFEPIFPFLDELPTMPPVVERVRTSRGFKEVAREPSKVERLAFNLTHPTNRRFAEATVNRVWRGLFGRALVGPADDMDAAESPHRLLLAMIAEDFTANGYDLRQLVRTLVYTRAYRRESRRPEGQEDPAAEAEALREAGAAAGLSEALARADLEKLAVARSALRPLTPRQIVASILRITGVEPVAIKGRMKRGSQVRTKEEYEALRERLIASFEVFYDEAITSAEAFEGTVLQSLLMFNGELINGAIQPAPGSMLRDILSHTGTSEQLVDKLFLSVLSRDPSPRERSLFAEYLKSSRDRREAAVDLMWALINSSEFLMNH